MTDTLVRTDAPASVRASHCPVCGAPAADPFVRIPDQPVHCNLLWDDPRSAAEAPRGDIELTFCESCGHVYNVAFDAAATQYGGTYENSLHHSGVFQGYAEALVASLVSRYDLRGRDIVEIGAGQGDFLRMLCHAGDNRGTGFDPSHVPTVARAADGKVSVVPAFYGPEFADHPADVIVCRHVLEHIEHAGDFVRMVRDVIGRRSTLVFFEVPDATWTLKSGGVWDIIYEHCGYFTPTSLREVFRRAGFSVDRTESVFGGQFLTLEAHPTYGGLSASNVDRGDVDSLRTAVDALRNAVTTFGDAYRHTVEEWRRRIEGIRDRGETAVVWGAGSKGVTFLNVVDHGGLIDHVVDMNPRKHGQFVAGTAQRIIDPPRLKELDPDLVIVMNPNYRDEIASQLSKDGIAAQVLVA